MKLNLKKTMLTAGLMALAGASLLALAQSDSLSGKLDRRVSYYNGQGYTLMQTRSGDLEEGYGRSHYFTLNQGWEYRLVAVCDADCDDLDLALYDGDDLEVDRDWEPDDFPLVSARPRLNDVYRLRVDMAACDLEPCGYRVAVLARRR